MHMLITRQQVMKDHWFWIALAMDPQVQTYHKLGPKNMVSDRLDVLRRN